MHIRGLPQPFVPKKRLGQNFLVDKRCLEKILKHAEVSPSEIVLEVGAGTGTLTELLQGKARKVIAIEKDYRLVDLLHSRFRNNHKIEIVKADILRMDLPYHDKVVATPPYNISSKLLFRLLNERSKTIVLTLQKEFAERLVADPGTKNYGRLTVMITHNAKAEIMDYVSRDAFRPKPKVDSAIVKIVPNELKHSINEEIFADLVRGLFTQRRRNLRSVLRHYVQQRIRSLPEEILKLDIPNKRVYQVSVEEFEKLTQDLAPLLSTQVTLT